MPSRAPSPASSVRPGWTSTIPGKVNLSNASPFAEPSNDSLPGPADSTRSFTSRSTAADFAPGGSSGEENSTVPFSISTGGVLTPVAGQGLASNP